MSDRKHGQEPLRALERWRTSQLDDAKVTMVQLNAEAADRLSTLTRIQSEIEALQSLVREQAQSAALLNADALLRMTEFSGYQQEQLNGAQDQHRQAAERADDAQRSVLHLFQQLSLVERLLERRQEVADTEQQRQSQKQLDEGALSRAPHIESN